MSDDDYLLKRGIRDIDEYEFSERVSKMLEHEPNPPQFMVNECREQVIWEMQHGL